MLPLGGMIQGPLRGLRFGVSREIEIPNFRFEIRMDSVEFISVGRSIVFNWTKQNLSIGRRVTL